MCIPVLTNNEQVINDPANDSKNTNNSENLKNEPDGQTTNDTSPPDEKPVRGEFCTRIFGTRRPSDPRAFKCSCCSKRTIKLHELNAHFISTHHRVKCDMCDQYFNTPSSLKKHKYPHSDEKYACLSCDCEFPFESQLHSHHYSHRRGRSYLCVFKNCNSSYHQLGDLNAHAKTHYSPILSCKNCDYKTQDKRNLKSHLRKHT